MKVCYSMDVMSFVHFYQRLDTGWGICYDVPTLKLDYEEVYMQEETTIPQMVEDVRAGRMPRRNFMKALAAIGISTAGIGAITAAAANRSAPSPQTNMKLDKEAIEQ